MKRVIYLLLMAVVMLGLMASCADRRAGDPIAPELTGVTITVIDGTNSYVNIKVKGGFDPDWGVLHPMVQNGNVWTVTINDIPEGVYEWGAIEDDGSEWGIWLIEGPNPTVDVNANGYGQATYEIPEPQGVVNITLQVDMSAEQVSGDGVHVAGSFQNWDPGATLLADDDMDNIYSVTVEMDMGSTIQFKFVNGTTWPEAEAVPAEHGVDDNNGGFNRQEVVPNEDATFTYIFGGAPVE